MDFDVITPKLKFPRKAFPLNKIKSMDYGVIYAKISTLEYWSRNFGESDAKM